MSEPLTLSPEAVDILTELMLRRSTQILVADIFRDLLAELAEQIHKDTGREFEVWS